MTSRNWRTDDLGDAGAIGEKLSDVAGNSVSVATWTVVSRITGLVRVATIAAVLGPTFFGNIYQATNLLPNVTYEFLTGSLFASLLVPALMRSIDLGDRRTTQRLAGGFLGTALLGFAVIAVVVICAGALVMDLFALTVDDATASAGYQRIGWPLLAMLMPQVMLYGVVGTGVAVQNAHGRFAFAAAAPALENLGVVATLLVSAVLFGTGTPISQVTTAQLLVLGFGTTAAVALHAAGQWWGAARVGVRLRPRAGWRDREVQEIIRLTVPSLGYAGLNALRFFGILVVASSVPGGVIAFQLAVNFFNLPVALGARPVAQALLPDLSRFHLNGALGKFKNVLDRGLAMSFLVTVPAAVAYIALAYPLARAVSFGEMAGSAGIALVAVSVAALGAGVVGDGSFVVLTHASYARKNARAPMQGMALRTVIALAGMIVAAVALDGPAVLIALGLAVSLGDLVGAVLLGRSVGVALPSGEGVAGALGRSLLAALAMAGPAYLSATWVAGALDMRGSYLLGIVVAALVGIVTFIGVHYITGSQELRLIIDGFRQRRAADGSRAT